MGFGSGVVVDRISLQNCREQVIKLFEQGINQLAIRLYSVDGAPRSDAIEAFANEVIEPLRSKT